MRVWGATPEPEPYVLAWCVSNTSPFQVSRNTFSGYRWPAWCFSFGFHLDIFAARIFVCCRLCLDGGALATPRVGVPVSVIPSVLTGAPGAGVAAPGAALTEGQGPTAPLRPSATVPTGVCCSAVRHGACLTLASVVSESDEVSSRFPCLFFCVCVPSACHYVSSGGAVRPRGRPPAPTQRSDTPRGEARESPTPAGFFCARVPLTRLFSFVCCCCLSVVSASECVISECNTFPGSNRTAGASTRLVPSHT